MALELRTGPLLDKQFTHAVDDAGNNVSVVALHPDSPGGGGGGTPSRLLLEAMPPKTATATASLLVGGNTLRKQIRIRNVGPGKLGVGAEGVTMASAGIVLEVGDTLIDTLGAAVEMHVVSDSTAQVAVEALVPEIN